MARSAVRCIPEVRSLCDNRLLLGWGRALFTNCVERGILGTEGRTSPVRRLRREGRELLLGASALRRLDRILEEASISGMPYRPERHDSADKASEADGWCEGLRFADLRAIASLMLFKRCVPNGVPLTHPGPPSLDWRTSWTAPS